MNLFTYNFDNEVSTEYLRSYALGVYEYKIRQIKKKLNRYYLTFQKITYIHNYVGYVPTCIIFCHLQVFLDRVQKAET